MTNEYKFEAIEIVPDPKRYRNRIVKRAGEGWRLVQILVEPPAAMPSEYVLVLEREVHADERVEEAEDEEVEEEDIEGEEEWADPAYEEDDL